MTEIKKTLDKTQEIITNLFTKLDIANLGNWTAEKKDLTDLLTYLKDKSQTKPTTFADGITIDLSEIENLEATLKTLTDNNTQLTTDNADLTTKNTEQDGIIKGTTIPNLIASLEQYASKVADGELKTSLVELKTRLETLKNSQEEIKGNLGKDKEVNYWTIGACMLGGISVILLSYLAFFKSNKNSENYERE